MADAFVEVGVPGQRSVGGVRLPAVLAPVPAAAGLDLRRFTEAVRVQKARLEALLRSSGAVLLRGFPVRTAADFDAAVEAFGYEELPYVGGAAPRTHVVGRVFTANESPPDQKIPFHHEMAQVPEFPSKLFFFCEEEPGSGGETPIVLSHRIYERMREKYPDFVERLDRHGLIYTRVLGAGDDPSSPIGRGWQSTFLTKDRSTAEERFLHCFFPSSSVQKYWCFLLEATRRNSKEEGNVMRVLECGVRTRVPLHGITLCLRRASTASGEQSQHQGSMA